MLSFIDGSEDHNDIAEIDIDIWFCENPSFLFLSLFYSQLNWFLFDV